MLIDYTSGGPTPNTFNPWPPSFICHFAFSFTNIFFLGGGVVAKTTKGTVSYAPLIILSIVPYI